MTTITDLALSKQDFASNQQVTLEWVQNLPLKLKDEALYKYLKITEVRPTLAESLTLIQVIYRTVTGNTFTESADSIAARTGHNRKTILKGLNQAVQQNILEKNDRPGTSTEYSFKPVEEWLSEPLRVRQSPAEGNPPAALDSPVVHKTDIRTKKIIEFPSSQECTEAQSDEESGVVQITDDHIMDSNTVVVNELLEQTTKEVSVPESDTLKSSHWKYVGQGLPRVYVAPELDQETGSKIESIHEATSRPRQFILKEAVDLLYNQINRIPSFLEEKPKPKFNSVGSVIPSAVSSGIPDDVLVALSNAGIDLGLGTAERLWVSYSDKFEEAIAYTIAQDVAGKIKQSKSGFFRRSLEEGWNLTIKPQVRDTSVPMVSELTKGIDEPTSEEMTLIDEAIAIGRARDKYYGTHGWLVIRLSGHSESWRDFLYK